MTTRSATYGQTHGLIDGYLDALAARDPARLPVADDLRVTENGHPLPFGRGLFETATEVSYRHVVTDDAGGSVVAFTVVHEGPLPADVMVHLAVADRPVGGAGSGPVITGIETAIARRGDASIARSDQPTEPKPIYGQVLEPADRARRADLVAVADRYFQAIEDDTTDVPFHPDCNRTVNGQQTTNRGPAPLSCRAQFEARIFSYITAVRDRRYLAVDESRGLVFAVVLMDVPARPEDFATFPIPYDRLPDHMKTPHTILLAELFKIVGGRIREIEALMTNIPLGATSGWSGPR
jgi:hypothetical protein